MRLLGGLLILLGLAAIAVKLNAMYSFVKLEFGFIDTIETQLDQWGDLVGWGIRGGVLVLGLIFWAAGGRR